MPLGCCLWEMLIRALRPRFDFTYTTRSGLARGLHRRGGLGFLPGRPLTPEERWLQVQPWTGKVVYDIGAWEGVLALFFARAVGSTGAVVAFEPNSSSAARLRTNLALNGISHVFLFEVALGEADGHAWLHVPRGVAARSQLIEQQTDLPVLVKRLDALVAEAALPLPNFIKVDVEGAELAVLRGAQATLTRCSPDMLIEVHPQTDRIALWMLLDGLGYDLHCLETRKALRSLVDLQGEQETQHWIAQSRRRQLADALEV